MNSKQNRIICSLVFLLAFVFASSQNKVVYAKSFVKQNKVLLRWVPSDKKVFDVAVKNGYKITRFTNEENVLSRPPVVTVTITPYPLIDTLKWAKLIKNNESAIVAYKVIHGTKKKATTPQEVSR